MLKFILVELILDHLQDVLYFYWRSVGTRRGLQNIQLSSVFYMHQYSEELGFILKIDKPTIPSAIQYLFTKESSINKIAKM